MEDLQDEIRDLREKNSELVVQVQHWKMTAAQREKEKLDLLKEINDLRLKLSRLRSGGAAEARKLDAAIQSASEEALTHLVQASGVVARNLELVKQYMLNRQELDLASPRWSNIGGTPPSDSKVNKVPPLHFGGQAIQPVVALRRTMLNSSTRSRSPNQNPERVPVPIHMLQDVYIPLTRIDIAELQGTAESDLDNSADDLGLQDSEQMDESQNISEDMDGSRRLDDVMEEAEPEDDQNTSSRAHNYSSRLDPLEGPSWLLDVPQTVNMQRFRRNLEPDSTTPCDQPADDAEKENEPLSVSLAFTPTVRRRKRASSPPAPLSPLARDHRQRHKRASNSNRVLKVVVAKMRLSNESEAGSPPKMAKIVSSPRSIDTPQRRSTTDTPIDSPRSPVSSPRRISEINTQGGSDRPSPRRPDRSDAPSPNGTTDAGVVVLEDSGTAEQRVTHRRHVQSSNIDSDFSDDAISSRDVSECHDVSERHNVSGRHSVNELWYRHVNERPQRRNVNARRSRSVSRERNDSNDKKRSVSRNERDVSERCVKNPERRIFERNNSEDAEFRGFSEEEIRSFVSERSYNHVSGRNVNESHDGSDRNISVKNENVSECNVSERHENVSGRNVSNRHDINITERTERHERNITARANERTGRNVADTNEKFDKNDTKINDRSDKYASNTNKRSDKNATNTNERSSRNVTERNVSERHDNVSERTNDRSVRNDTPNDRNATEPSSSRQSHDVESDTSTNGSDYDVGRGRSRRNKKKVTYTEVPLNRKMRR